VILSSDSLSISLGGVNISLGSLPEQFPLWGSNQLSLIFIHDKLCRYCRKSDVNTVNTVDFVVIIKLRETTVKQNLINDNLTPVSRNKITFKVKLYCTAENELLHRGIV
jgi:hypothetical protein